MKRIILSLLLFSAQSLMAQEVKALWTGTPPYAKPNSLKEMVKAAWGVPCAHNVTLPTLTIHRAQGKPSGHAMIILPGGGYELESIVAEGQLIAKSQLYANALAKAGQDVEVHFFAKGGHGFGPGRSEGGTAQWLGLLAHWIKRQ